MWFFDLVAAMRSLVLCRGKHDYVVVEAFLVDANGSDFNPSFGGLRGRNTIYGRCSRCSRRDDGKGFDH